LSIKFNQIVDVISKGFDSDELKNFAIIVHYYDEERNAVMTNYQSDDGISDQNIIRSNIQVSSHIINNPNGKHKFDSGFSPSRV